VGGRHPAGKAPLEEIYAEASVEGIDRAHAEDMIAKMRRSGDLMKPDHDSVKLV